MRTTMCRQKVSVIVCGSDSGATSILPLYDIMHMWEGYGKPQGDMYVRCVLCDAIENYRT